MSIESAIASEALGVAAKSGVGFLGGWQLKAILAVVALVGIGTPGFLFYRHITHIEADNKTLTTDRDHWKQTATYWYQQNQATLTRLKDAQSTMGLLAVNRTTATETQRKVTNAFKQTPASTAADASGAVNDAFGVLACSSAGSCNPSAAHPAHRPARP